MSEIGMQRWMNKILSSESGPNRSVKYNLHQAALKHSPAPFFIFILPNILIINKIIFQMSQCSLSLLKISLNIRFWRFAILENAISCNDKLSDQQHVSAVFFIGIFNNRPLLTKLPKIQSRDLIRREVLTSLAVTFIYQSSKLVSVQPHIKAN